jgi:hypothetical protein
MPVADFSCDLNGLKVASACLSDSCVSVSDRAAIDIYVRVNALKAVGGIDYTNNLTGLLQDSKLWQKQSEDTLERIGLYIDILNALEDGAIISADPHALLAKAKCLTGKCLGKEQTRGVLAFLKCQLNTLGTPE